MPEQAPVTIDRLQQLLNDFDERLTYLEQVVVPERVTKKELESATINLWLRLTGNLGQMSSELRAVQQQLATIDDLDRLRAIVSRARAELVDANRASKKDETPGSI